MARTGPYLVLDRSHHLAAGLARWKSARRSSPVPQETRPGRRAGPGHVQGEGRRLCTSTRAELADGGRVLALPLSNAKRREITPAAGRLRSVRVVKDNRGRRAANLISQGRGQVQNVTYPFSGGHRWGSPADARAARGRNPADPATTPDTGSLGRGGCREGRHVATINAPLPGVSDSCGHIDAPMFLRRALKDLALAARKLELTEAGGRRHAKALVRVQRLHGRVAARRATWQQHLADRPRSAMRKERAAAPVGRH